MKKETIDAYRVQLKLWHPNLRQGKWFGVMEFESDWNEKYQKDMGKLKADLYALKFPKESVRIANIERV